jgi:phosphate:Na+ symporter
MSGLQTLFAVISSIVLFLYSLRSFSRELQVVGGTALQAWLGRVTASRWRGFAVGAIATAIVQSSSAMSSLTTALVDASVISFRASLGVLLGSNVGTTTTAWLVSFKLTGIGPVFIVLGALLSALPVRAKVLGEAIFYFGLIFFALDLIAHQLEPLRQLPAFREWLTLAQSPSLGVLTGLLFTAVIQSSSVTTGVAILLVQQGILPAEAAVPIVIGANVGSTSTALVASVSLGVVARATAVTNFLFNAAGAIIFFPFLRSFASAMVDLAGEPAKAVAWAHLVFNLTIAGVFLATLDWIEPILRQRLITARRPPPPGGGTTGREGFARS